MAQLTPQDDYMKTALRLPRELHALIQEAAASAGRSMNAEIVARLQASFPRAIPNREEAQPTREEVQTLQSIMTTLAELPSSDYQPGSLLRATIERLVEQVAEQAVLSILQERGLAPPEKKG